MPIPELVDEWVHSTPFPIVVLGEDHTTLTTNQAFGQLLRQTGMETETLVGELLSTEAEPIFLGKDLLTVLEDFQCVVKRVELPGNQHYVSHIVRLRMDGRPCLCCILMPGSDPSQTYLTGILNTITSFIIEIDSKGNVGYINDQLLTHLGYSADDRKTLNHLQMLQPDFNGEKLRQRIEEVKVGGVCRFRTEFINKEGAGVKMEASMVRNQTPGDSSYLLTARDISLQLALEKELQDALVEANQEGRALEIENTRLRIQAEQASVGQELIYRSEAFAAVVNRLRQVAPTDATVLITGETGTGKELLARTIHRLSRRSGKAIVTVDCGSLPPELIESELFGYQKGAFTGAYRDRVGRFEAADGGTIFLDEIGDLPLLMQTRLLRVLQDGEFTPVGKTTSQRTDVRVIAATNRDLYELVQEGKFRADLYYRLNVFPIKSIPLRDRKEDIAPLVEHFIRRFNKQFSKDLTGPNRTTLDRLETYDFPGNVRELENMVERAFVVSGENDLRITLPSGDRNGSKPVLDIFDGQLTEFLTFEEYQRKYIKLVLKSTGGKVSGKDGAALVLDMNPQTLFSKMRRLGIRR